MSAMINEDDLKEFRQEGAELLEAAEKALLSLEEGADYKTQYNAIFRAFHNLKGAAGMMEMLNLQAHTHILETELVSLKEKASLTSNQIDFFLKGVDTAKKMLWGESLATEPAPHVPTSQNVLKVVPPLKSGTPAQPVPVAITPDKPKQIMVEPNRYLLFSEGNELSLLETELKKLNFEVQNCSDYIEGITKYDELMPHVIFVSPKFVQTSIEELKSILNKDGHTQLFIDFDFTQAPMEFLMKYIRSHFENTNLKNLVDQATDLLKFHYADMLEYLRIQEKQHLGESLTEEMRDLLRFKSTIGRKFKG